MKNNYKDNRENCASVVASSCISYTGEIDIESLKDKCPLNLNDIVEELLKLIKEIQEGVDVKDLDLSCLEECVLTNDLTIANLLKIIVTKLCKTMEDITKLQEHAQNPLNSTITIDLSCFSTNPCYSNKQEYTLFEVITLLISELCTLKNKYDVLLQSM